MNQLYRNFLNIKIESAPSQGSGGSLFSAELLIAIIALAGGLISLLVSKFVERRDTIEERRRRL